MTTISIPVGNRRISVGDGFPTHLVAEIGLNHNGSEEIAYEMIRQAALSGATFAKFQKRSPSDLATATFLDEPFLKAPALGCTQREVRTRLELSDQTYLNLLNYAESLGLIFSASAFDIPSLNFLINSGVRVIKIASHSITNGPLLNEVSRSGVSVIASLGAATEEEKETAIEILSKNPLILMHCVSSYPTPDNESFLDTINLLKSKYSFPVGFSSHEIGIDISTAAATLGASIIERHFTLKRSMIGLDQSISLEPEEFSELANRIKRIHKARGIHKNITSSEEQARSSYHVAVCAKSTIKAGTTITPELLACKQPLIDSSTYFTGLEIEKVIGRIAKIDLLEDQAIPRKSIM